MILSNIRTYLAVSTCYIGALTASFVFGFPSPTQKELLEKNILDYQTLPIFASISHLTRCMGLITAPLAIQCGINLKLLSILSGLIGVTGYLLIMLAESGIRVIIGISFEGFSSGIGIIFMNTYMAEITLDNQRKVLTGGIGFCIRIGVFVAYFAGIWLNFRWLAVIGIILTCVYCFMIVVSPLSPVWYVQHGLREKAKSTLFYLHGDHFDADSEIEKIKGKTLRRDIGWIETIRTFKDWKVLKPMLIMAVIASLKELGGHEAMVAFSSHILENQQAIDPKVASLFYPICLIAGSIVCIFILKYLKIKWLMITASFLQAISHISMAIYYLVSEHYLHCNTQYTQICHTLAFWPILNIALFAFSFALGWGLVFFAMMGVMFTVHRELFTAITCISSNLSSYVVVLIFFYLLHSIGGFITFLIFACNYIIAIVFVYFCLDI